jgi:hypothetical protein
MLLKAKIIIANSFTKINPFFSESCHSPKVAQKVGNFYPERQK